QLLALFGAGAATLAAACSKGASTALGSASTTSSSSTTTSSPSTTASATASESTTTASCVLTPEMTEGPYYISGEANRSDITEGTAGTPLKLVLPVVNASTCKPIPGATVEIW